MNAKEALGPWLKRYWGLEIVMSDSHTVQLSDAAIDASADARDAARYRVIRNPPYSDQYGDLYAMTFQGEGDVPVKAEQLDALADAAIAASDSSENEATK